MRAAPNPRTLTGWSGASHHGLRFPCGLSSGFPFARGVLPLRPPSSGFPSSGVLRFVSFGRCPGSGSLRFPSWFPSASNAYASAAARRFRRRWSRAAGTKVTSSAAVPCLDRAIGPHYTYVQHPTASCAAALPVPGRSSRSLTIDDPGGPRSRPSCAMSAPVSDTRSPFGASRESPCSSGGRARRQRARHRAGCGPGWRHRCNGTGVWP